MMMQVLDQLLLPPCYLGLWRNLLTAFVLILWHG